MSSSALAKVFHGVASPVHGARDAAAKMKTSRPKRVVVLVGLKGAGKTTLGLALAASGEAAFLRIEPIYLAAMRANPDLAPPELEPIGFGAILRALAVLAHDHATTCLETTATAGYFPQFLDQLRATYRVCLVRVLASTEVCLYRVRMRDSADHSPVSDARVREINRIAATVKLDWNLELENSAGGGIDGQWPPSRRCYGRSIADASERVCRYGRLVAKGLTRQRTVTAPLIEAWLMGQSF